MPPTSAKVVSSSGGWTSKLPLPSLGIIPPRSPPSGLCVCGRWRGRRRRAVEARGVSGPRCSGGGSGSACETSTHRPVAGSKVYEPEPDIMCWRSEPSGEAPKGEGSASPPPRVGPRSAASRASSSSYSARRSAARRIADAAIRLNTTKSISGRNRTSTASQRRSVASRYGRRLGLVADWATISALATAGGTLVLAGATFASVRSANRAARAAEVSLLANLRPLLLPSRLDDPSQKVGFADSRFFHVPPGGGVAEITDQAIYLVISVRNVGNGLAILHGWRFSAGERSSGEHPPLDEFTMLSRDIYVAPADVGFWQGVY